MTSITLRTAVRADIPMLEGWDEEPHVQASDPGSGDGWEWEDEIEAGLPGFWHFVAQADGVPIGFVQIIDPHIEPTRYWGDMPPGLRAIDIWIGPAQWLGRGAGTRMMALALEWCFASPDVHTILIDPLATNTRAHRFYERCGFRFLERRQFGADICHVYQLNRADWRPGD
jgi:aminoglycoside 6'-N-acetyltransferase